MKIHKFCIFQSAPDQQPAWHDGDTGLPVVFDSEREAQLQIVEDITERIAQFKEDPPQRDFDDLVWDDWVEVVQVDEHGVVTDADGNVFGKLIE